MHCCATAHLQVFKDLQRQLHPDKNPQDPEAQHTSANVWTASFSHIFSLIFGVFFKEFMEPYHFHWTDLDCLFELTDESGIMVSMFGFTRFSRLWLQSGSVFGFVSARGQGVKIGCSENVFFLALLYGMGYVGILWIKDYGTCQIVFSMGKARVASQVVKWPDHGYRLRNWLSKS